MPERSLVREALDEVMRRHPFHDVARVWHDPQGEPPWATVELRRDYGEALNYAIWKRTGALHLFLESGAVSDDPVWTPGQGSQNLPVGSTYAEVAALLREIAAHVDAGDSFEGSFEYLMPNVPEWAQRGEPQPEGWTQADCLLRGVYRIGNTMGQGGVVIVGTLGRRASGETS